MDRPTKEIPLSSCPSSLPLSRRHNWSFDHYKASSPSVSFLPSPTHSKSHRLVSNPSTGCLPRMSLPPHSRETSLAHKKNTKFDEYYPFPNFSASPSPSPSPFPSPSAPIHIPGSQQSKALLPPESAPVNIPVPKLANSAALSSKQNLPPSPPLKISRVGISRTDNDMSPVKSGATMDMPFSFGKGDCHGVRLSFNSLPQISFSGSSNRSLQVDFDYSECPCPFDVNDDDMMDTVSRPKSSDRTGHPSDQNEAVYALVRLLEKAPPLHQDVSSSINFSEASKPEKWSNSIQEQNQISEAATVEHAAPSIIASVTTADALEELQAYKEMKNVLLGEGGKSYTSANFASGAEYSSKGK